MKIVINIIAVKVGKDNWNLTRVCLKVKILLNEVDMQMLISSAKIQLNKSMRNSMTKDRLSILKDFDKLD